MMVTHAGAVSGYQCILVDDILTSGGHMRAAATRIRDAGGTLVLAAVVAQATRDAHDEPFAPRVVRKLFVGEELEDWTELLR
jgi:phosphoribosylpyrophosphate synthetase